VASASQSHSHRRLLRLPSRSIHDNTKTTTATDKFPVSTPTMKRRTVPPVSVPWTSTGAASHAR